MLWSDETKVDLSGHNDVSMFRVNGDAFKCKNTVPSVEHGGTIMLCGCFPDSGTRTLYKVDEIMMKMEYQILQLHLKFTTTVYDSNVVKSVCSNRTVMPNTHQNWFGDG